MFTQCMIPATYFVMQSLAIGQYDLYICCLQIRFMENI